MILQHKYYRKILNTHFIPEQNIDTRFILPSTTITFIQIFITECNPDKDFLPTKILYNEIIHIYEDYGKHLTSISTTRLNGYDNNIIRQDTTHMG